MLKRLAFLSGAVAYLTLLAGCGGGNNPIVGGPTKPADVYVAGYQADANGRIAAVYWKNGVLTKLADNNEGSVAYSIAVSGQDVYVAGAVNNGIHNVATVWKDGSPTALTDGTKNSEAISIFLASGNVYVAGYEDNGQSPGYLVAEYWKNGVPVALTDGSGPAEAFSIFVSGADVYVAGFEHQKTQTGPTNFVVAPVAKYWKNGVPVALTDGVQPAEALSVFVSGSDVYAAGYYQQDSTSGPIAAYWKNGTLIPLSKAMNTISRSVFVSGSDVYSVGDGSSVPEDAYFWKDGAEIPLPESATANRAVATQVVVSGGDVYVSGAEIEQNGVTTALYWKNGGAVPLTDGTSSGTAFGIAVVPPPR